MNNDPTGHKEDSKCEYMGEQCWDPLPNNGHETGYYEAHPNFQKFKEGKQPDNIENDIGDSENDESINISVGGTDYQDYVGWEGLPSDTDFWIDIIGLEWGLIPALQPFSTGLEILTVLEFCSATVTSWSTTPFVGQNGRKNGPFWESLKPTEQRNVVPEIISIVPELGANGSSFSIINAANYLDIQVST